MIEQVVSFFYISYFRSTRIPMYSYRVNQQKEYYAYIFIYYFIPNLLVTQLSNVKELPYN